MARKKTKGETLGVRLPLELEEALIPLVPLYGGTKTSAIVALIKLGIEKHYELIGEPQPVPKPEEPEEYYTIEITIKKH